MRIALFSDIHGNSIALDAVLADISQKGEVDGVWLLGDFVAIGHDPNGVLERITQLPDATFIRGNTDRYVVTGERPFPSNADAQENPQLINRLVEMNNGFAWTQGMVTAAGWFDWLAALPLEHRVTLPDGARFLGVHCAPGTDDGVGFSPAMAAAEVDDRLGDCAADLICVGHTHQAMDVRVGTRRLVNLGSVSNPIAPDLRASYAILEASESGYAITLHYVAYDYQAVINALEAVQHPGRAFISKFMRGEIWP